MKRYSITKVFIGGILEGLTHTGTIRVFIKPGTIVRHPSGGGSPYKVTECQEIITEERLSVNEFREKIAGILRQPGAPIRFGIAGPSVACDKAEVGLKRKGY